MQHLVISNLRCLSCDNLTILNSKNYSFKKKKKKNYVKI